MIATRKITNICVIGVERIGELVKVEVETEENVECPYGYASCDQDDWTSLCEGCAEDRAVAHSDAYNDTYD